MSSTLQIAWATYRRCRREGIRLSPQQFASVMKQVREIQEERARQRRGGGTSGASLRS